MAGKGGKFQRNKLVAKLVTEKGQPCVFCQLDVDDEVIYGKLYSLGDIQCHYFCVLLSCCLVQKGRDTKGLFGFLYKDIIAEVERSKKHKCSYCGRGGASLGCCVSQCRKQFHLPCGRRRNAVSLFYGNYKSFCEVHAPKQKISDDVMASARVRLKRDKMLKSKKEPTAVKDTDQKSEQERVETVCVICYEEVQGYPTSQTFWPPCCGRDAWLHRSCLQRMALSAGMHFLKCPLCNDKEQFHEAVCEQGYYLPDRDAAWELEQNAFAEIYERPASCGAADCRCPLGRDHDEPGIWDVKLCLLCGSCGLHAGCAGAARVVCAACRPAAPRDIAALEDRLEEMMREEQGMARNARRGPLMPSRMSLRRTKSRLAARSEIVEDLRGKEFNEKPKSKSPLKQWNTPKKCFDVTELTDEDSKENVNIKTVSAEATTVTEKLEKAPGNVIATGLFEHNSSENLNDENDNSDDNDVEMINDSTDDENITNDDESSTSTFQLPAEFIAESDDSLPIFDTPKKLKSNIEHNFDEVKRASGDKNEFIKTITLRSPRNHCSLKFSATDKEILHACNVDVDVETFKDQYLSEVDRFKYTFKENHLNFNDNVKLCTVVDAVDATDRTRKLEFEEDGGKRKKKDKPKRKVSVFNDNLDSKEMPRLRTLRKKAREWKLKKKDVRLKIKWKGEKDKDKVRKKKQKLKTYKQYVLKYSPTLTNKVIEKPDVDVTPRKRKYIKLEKTPDNLVQTSIKNFFKFK